MDTVKPVVLYLANHDETHHKMLQSKASASGGGRRKITRTRWTRFTVMYSMKRFITMGGGLLLLRDRVDNSPVIALIGRRSSK